MGSVTGSRSAARLQRLAVQICALTTVEHNELFNMIQEHNAGAKDARCVDVTLNRNGAFFDLAAAPDALIERMEAAVVYFTSNKRKLDEYEERLQRCRLLNDFHAMAPPGSAASAAAADGGGAAFPAPQRPPNPPAALLEQISREAEHEGEAALERVDAFVQRLGREHADAVLQAAARRMVSTTRFANLVKHFSKRTGVSVCC